MVVSGRGGVGGLLHPLLPEPRRPPRERGDGRQQGRGLPRPHRRHEPVEGGVRRRHPGADPGRGDGGRGRLPGLLGQGHGDPGDGPVDGPRPDRLRAGQPGPGDQLPGGGGRAVGRDHGHRPLRLPQPGQQRPRLPLHLPRRARRAGHRHHRGDEDGGRPGPGGAGPGGRAGVGLPRLRRREVPLRPRVHHPQAARPAGAALGGAGGGQGGHGRRRGPHPARPGRVPASSCATGRAAPTRCSGRW